MAWLLTLAPVQSHVRVQGSNAPCPCCKQALSCRGQGHASMQECRCMLLGEGSRPPPKEAEETGSVFRDPKTGAFFEAPEGESPLKDQKGELAFRPISYTPWPVPEDYEGTRLRVAVGERSSKEMRTFVFNKLRPDSELLLVTLPRPLGIVFEYDERRKQAYVVDLVEGSYADQRKKVAGLNQRLQECVLPGDVLRAVSCTNFVYPTNALFGAKAPERHIVMYGADKQKWSSIRGALKKGDMKDGEVSLVVERRRTQ